MTPIRETRTLFTQHADRPRSVLWVESSRYANGRNGSKADTRLGLLWVEVVTSARSPPNTTVGAMGGGCCGQINCQSITAAQMDMDKAVVRAQQ